MAFFFRAEENGGEKNIKKKKKKKSENEKEIPRNREIPSTWGRTPGPRCGASLPQLSKKKEEEEKGTKKKRKKKDTREDTTMASLTFTFFLALTPTDVFHS